MQSSIGKSIDFSCREAIDFSYWEDIEYSSRDGYEWNFSLLLPLSLRELIVVLDGGQLKFHW